MQTPTAGMIELAEVVKQYQAGLMTFSEFILKVMGFLNSEETILQLIELNKLEYKEMIEFERLLGL